MAEDDPVAVGAPLGRAEQLVAAIDFVFVAAINVDHIEAAVATITCKSHFAAIWANGGVEATGQLAQGAGC